MKAVLNLHNICQVLRPISCKKSAITVSNYNFLKYNTVLGNITVPHVFVRHASLSPTICRHHLGDGNRALLDIKLHLWRQQNSFLSNKPYNLTTPLFLKAENFRDRIALVDQFGSHTYNDILILSNRLSDKIADLCNAPGDDLGGKSVCFLCESDSSYVVTNWAIWVCGGVSVPLCKTHPKPELQYVIEDSQSQLVVCTQEYAEKVESICQDNGIPLLVLDKADYLPWEAESKDVGTEEEACKDVGTEDEAHKDVGTEDESRQQKRDNRLKQLHLANRFKRKPALILYTSGTTGRPKGVVHTHGSLQALITDMETAWEWSPSDVILHALPLHHMHGVACILLTPLYIGATCVIMPKFDAKKVWDQLLNPNIPGLTRRINVFMSVPTIYAKLIEDHEQRMSEGKMSKTARHFVKAVCSSQIRLMVSGSSSLPPRVMHQWEEITGHRLLERYGMTELGMALTNPLHGHRIPGAVGQPFPKVEVCIAKSNKASRKGYDVIAQGNARRTYVTPGMEDEQGELYVRGPNVFTEYWNRPEATKDTFTVDGWFKTGDTVCYTDGAYKILGRTSVDIIKSGGYKISALDVERHLMSHEDISDVAVVGLPDITWGQRVAAVIVLKSGDLEIDLDALRNWAKELMPPYQVPSVIRVVDSMPRNSMGKVDKKELQQQVFSKELKKVMG